MNKLITLKCYNRPMYLYRVLVGLSECINISNYRLIISIDHVDINCQTQMINAIQLSDIANIVSSIEVIVHNKQQYCPGNTKFVLTKGFKESDYVIHLEDDTLPTKDLLLYFEYVSKILDENKLFAACPFHRPCHETNPPTAQDVDKLVAKKWFDGSGGFAMTIKQWNRIQEMGGMFGISSISARGRSYNCVGESWLSEITKGNLSWVWPFHKYFSEGKYTLFPKVSRTVNIGEVGLHCDKTIHQKVLYNENIISKYNAVITEYNDKIFYDNSKYIEQGIE